MSDPVPNDLRPEDIVALKSKLRYMGYYHGRCDGVVDEYLIRAIEQFHLAKKPKGAPTEDKSVLDEVKAVAAKSFIEVLDDELKALRGVAACEDAGDTAAPAAACAGGPTAHASDVIAAAHRNAMAGLALSGGGIRSATFNLGILQSLAEAGLLRHFDYLSTVSGGGYIGGWLSKWIHKRGIDHVEELLGQTMAPGLSRREPSQVTFLRQYSNYLTPKMGLFTADTWTLFATYLRNTTLNLVILSLFLAALLILPRWWISIVHPLYDGYAWAFLAIGSIAFLAAVHNIAFAISCKPHIRSRSPHDQRWVLWRIVLPLLLAAMLGCVGLWWLRQDVGRFWTRHDWPLILLAPGAVYFFAWATGWDRAQHRNEADTRAGAPGQAQPGGKLATLALKGSPLLVAALLGCAGTWWVRTAASAEWTRSKWPLILLTVGIGYFVSWVIGWDRAEQRNWPQNVPARSFGERLASRAATMWNHGLPHLFCAIGAFALGSVLIVGVSAAVMDSSIDLVHVISFGAPLLLLIFGITMVIMIGLVGRRYSDQTREWWARQGAWTFISAIGTTALFLFSLYSPALVMWTVAHLQGLGSALLTSGWLGTVWATLHAARSPAAQPGASRVLGWVPRFGPALVIGWTLAGIATIIHLMSAGDHPARGDAFAAILRSQLEAASRVPSLTLWAALFVAFIIALTLAYCADVNKFSLYMMYRNRLVRAYLGAIDAGRRRPHPFTGFAPGDDMLLAQLGGRNGKAQRPYLIVNAAVNLVKGNELAWQTRKAASFTFTPRYCGFETPVMPVSDTAGAADESARGGYRSTDKYGASSKDPDYADKGVKLGMAMAVSGAAVASSMGFHSSPTLAFVMTMFNVRLGRWCGNPGARDDSWERASPPAGVAHLFRELLGFTDAASSFLYLSDGGHFENLGIYELVRRRCRLVVAVDATADRQCHFDDLGNAIRKCYTDFNIEIDIDVGNLKRAAATGMSRAYYVIGTIRYAATDPNALDGTLVYIKPALIGSELAAIMNYHLTNPEFPHQSTADQWFDETQFESYRSLGQHIGNSIFADLGKAIQAEPGTAGAVEQLCLALRAGVREQRRARQYPWWHPRHWL